MITFSSHRKATLYERRLAYKFFRAKQKRGEVPATAKIIHIAVNVYFGDVIEIDWKSARKKGDLYMPPRKEVQYFNTIRSNLNE